MSLLAILSAWYRFVTRLQVTTSFALGYGTTHTRVVSIPQGCPHSMRILGLVVAPWCRAVRSNRMIPRALADDLIRYCQFPHGDHPPCIPMNIVPVHPPTLCHCVGSVEINSCPQ